MVLKINVEMGNEDMLTINDAVEAIREAVKGWGSYTNLEDGPREWVVRDANGNRVGSINLSED